MNFRYSDVKGSQKVNLVGTVLPKKIEQLQTLLQEWRSMEGRGDVGTKFRKLDTPRHIGPFQRLILEFQDLKRVSFEWGEWSKELRVAIKSSPYFRNLSNHVYASTSAYATDPDLPDGENTWLERLLVQRRELWAQWRVVETHPQTQRHKGETPVTEELEETLRVELMKLGREYAALFALSHYGPCVAIPDTSRLGADPTSKWDAQGGAFRVRSSVGKPASLTDPGHLLLQLKQEDEWEDKGMLKRVKNEYMVALDACGTRLSEVVPVVITEFSGRVQAAIEELQAELQEVLVSIAVDKGPPLLPANEEGTTVLAKMREICWVGR